MRRRLRQWLRRWRQIQDVRGLVAMPTGVLIGLLFSEAAHVVIAQPPTPIVRLSRDADASVVRPHTITVHATLSAAEHELADDPTPFAFDRVFHTGRPHEPFTLLTKGPSELRAFCARARGRPVVLTLWEVPQ